MEAILDGEDQKILEWMLKFCNAVWYRQTIPDDWHLSRVAALYKKGDIGECGNYRPISFVCVGYKIFASIILARMKAGGAEARSYASQFWL